MPKFHLLAFAPFFLLLTLLINATPGSDLEIDKGSCGLIDDCGTTPVADSGSNSRLLMMLHRRYISYATLLRDLVPCNRPGASYYNCRAPAFANSYNRGCEMITRCARGY